jgi:hypothetical protein
MLSPPHAVVDAPPSATYRANLVTIVLGTWFTFGLFLDAWAHSNLTDLETFFTPWHGVFYTGFVCTAGWILATAHTAWRSGRDVRSIPAGYAAATVAVVGFGIAAVGDMLWHTAFGIEQSIDILFSPTHLGLIAAMFVILTTPLRSMWADPSLPAAPGTRRLLPALLSLSLSTTLVLLFLQYANALTLDSHVVVAGLTGADEGLTAELVSSIAVTNLVLLMPLLTLARRWVPPFGTATMLYAALGALSSAITAFENVAMIVGLLVAGVGVDRLASRLRPTPLRLRQFRLFAALAPLITWTVYIATAYLTTRADAGMRPPAMVELVTGTPLLQALLGLLVGIMLIPGGGHLSDHAPATTTADAA